VVALTRLENNKILKRHDTTLRTVRYAKHCDESGDNLHPMEQPGPEHTYRSNTVLA
jgi:hypothetical protein